MTRKAKSLNGFAGRASRPGTVFPAGAWAALALAAGVAAGCSGLPYWAKSPPQDRMAAVGMAPCPNAASQGLARTLAEADARARIAASTQARITSLVENWGKVVGDTAERKTFTSLLNDEAFIRQFVDRTVNGARPVEYHYDDPEDTLYALVVVDDPKKWLMEFTEASKEKAFATLLWTQAQKEDFARKMDQIRDRYAEEERRTLERLLPERAAPEEGSRPRERRP